MPPDLDRAAFVFEGKLFAGERSNYGCRLLLLRFWNKQLGCNRNRESRASVRRKPLQSNPMRVTTNQSSHPAHFFNTILYERTSCGLNLLSCCPE